MKNKIRLISAKINKTSIFKCRLLKNNNNINIMSNVLKKTEI